MSALGADLPSPREQLRRAVALLDDLYGRPMLAPRYPPVDELVYTVLSQNTADVNTDRTFAALMARFPVWSAARDASVAEIEEAIALGGLARTKAPRIKRILEALSDGSGSPASRRSTRWTMPRRRHTSRGFRAWAPRRRPAYCFSRSAGP